MTTEQAANHPGQESIAMLSKARDECFEQVGNLDLPLETRNELSKRHKKLAEIVDELLAKHFHDTSADFKSLKDLQSTNAVLSGKLGELDGMSKRLDSAQKFFNVLDQVIQVGATLVSLV